MAKTYSDYFQGKNSPRRTRSGVYGPRNKCGVARCVPLISLLLLLLILSAPAAWATGCTSPAGSAGGIIYNSANHAPQYCDGTTWRQMGPRGNGVAGGCTLPTASEGAIIYNSSSQVLQFCGGTKWYQMGPRGTGGAGCSSPTGSAGAVMSNNDKCTLQICDGSVWRQMTIAASGGGGGTTVVYITTANTSGKPSYSGNWTVTVGWNRSNNTVEGIGEGGIGGTGNMLTVQNCGVNAKRRRRRLYHRHQSFHLPGSIPFTIGDGTGTVAKSRHSTQARWLPPMAATGVTALQAAPRAALAESGELIPAAPAATPSNLQPGAAAARPGPVAMDRVEAALVLPPPLTGVAAVAVLTAGRLRLVLPVQPPPLMAAMAKAAQVTGLVKSVVRQNARPARLAAAAEGK